jgi:predicted DNA-binding protein (MmcQ/YjbR family)
MMIDDLREICLALPGTSYDFPFDEETCVFRVRKKMFALAGINTSPAHVTLKCDPDLARDLRVAYQGIVPGYHMNKEHWNTVDTGADVPCDKVEWLIRHSYDLVVASLPKSKRPGFTR